MKQFIAGMVALCLASCELSAQDVVKVTSGPLVSVSGKVSNKTKQRQQSDSPLAVIQGPTTGQPGDIVILDASKSTNATGFSWLVETDATVPAGIDPEEMRQWAEFFKNQGWRKPEKSEKPLWLISPDGKSVMLASYEGTYRATLAVGNTATDVPSIAQHVFVSVSGPRPPPDDDPPDDDDPPPPPPTFGLAEAVPGWLAQVDPQSRGQAVDVRAALIEVASKAPTANTIEDMNQIYIAAITELITSGTISGSAWRPFGEALSGALSGLKALGKITTPEHYGQALREIAGAM